MLYNVLQCFTMVYNALFKCACCHTGKIANQRKKSVTVHFTMFYNALQCFTMLYNGLQCPIQVCLLPHQEDSEPTKKECHCSFYNVLQCFTMFYNGLQCPIQVCLLPHQEDSEPRKKECHCSFYNVLQWFTMVYNALFKCACCHTRKIVNQRKKSVTVQFTMFYNALQCFTMLYNGLQCPIQVCLLPHREDSEPTKKECHCSFYNVLQCFTMFYNALQWFTMPYSSVLVATPGR